MRVTTRQGDRLRPPFSFWFTWLQHREDSAPEAEIAFTALRFGFPEGDDRLSLPSALRMEGIEPRKTGEGLSKNRQHCWTTACGPVDYQ